ncbi:uncharacterized protein LOC116015826 [Ipomoea triloba]|uniref:uncharacterized protein LOC116015826 n=1 Tax=Ipomoea triloba TaxID=35885 RepID=UPI00125D5827|nr:uncharacterized protein LOC116015826 [Ipomoea triloba]
MSGFSPVSAPLSFKHSNLQNFLSSVTPTVSLQAPKQKDGDTIEYFTLGDLWDCFEEWSVYGVGIPVILNSGVSVTQYYVPFLSAIQIYTNKLQQTSRNQKENEDVASTEGKKKDESLSKERDGISIERNKDCCDDKPSSEAEQHGHLYFQFCDTVSPYWRIPFIEKIAEFAEVHPGLMTFKTTDLSPASWISVAWYPIYQIPTKGNHKDRLSTCFLTYHALSSSSIRGGVNPDKDENKKGKKVLEMVKGEEGNNNIKKSTGDVLYPYPFGMATYRLDDEIWINANTFDDYERIIDLYNAAEIWWKLEVALVLWHVVVSSTSSGLGCQIPPLSIEENLEELERFEQEFSVDGGNATRRIGDSTLAMITVMLCFILPSLY